MYVDRQKGTQNLQERWDYSYRNDSTPCRRLLVVTLVLPITCGGFIHFKTSVANFCKAQKCFLLSTTVCKHYKKKVDNTQRYKVLYKVQKNVASIACSVTWANFTCKIVSPFIETHSYFPQNFMLLTGVFCFSIQTYFLLQMCTNLYS